MHRIAPRPAGSGAVMWWASAVDAAPMTSARIVAPRASAWSHSSSTRMPAPSPMTKPSRSTSKGREKSVEESAVMLRKPASAMSTMTASAPPATATGQRPVATRRAALPIAWVPAAHAVVTVSARSAQAEAHGDGGGRGVGHHHRDHEGRDAVRTPCSEQHPVLLEHRLQAADAGRHDAAGVDDGPAEAALAPGLVGGDQRVEGEGVEAAQLLGAAQVRRVKGGDALARRGLVALERAPTAPRRRRRRSSSRRSR